jgi:uncharacterized protein (DUF4415 family)
MTSEPTREGARARWGDGPQEKAMTREIDWSDAIKRPEIARKLGAKKVVTIRLDEGIVEYFRELGKELDTPYQTLINLYLRDCVARGRRPTGEWVEAPQSSAGEMLHFRESAGIEKD